MRPRAGLPPTLLLLCACEAAPNTKLLPDAPFITAAHVHLGGHAPEAGWLERAEQAFADATGGRVGLHIVTHATLAMPPVGPRELAEVQERFPHLLAEHALPVWYYEHQPQLIGDLKALVPWHAVEDPLVIVTTDAQFEGLGVYLEGLPRPTVLLSSLDLGGWNRGDAYSAARVIPASLADTLTHELGHYMGFGHSCDECIQDNRLDPTCCETCPARDDVMSYCRQRPVSRADAPNRFSECALRQIEQRVAPAMQAAQTLPAAQACP